MHSQTRRAVYAHFDERLDELVVLHHDHQHPVGRDGVPEIVEALLDDRRLTSDHHVGLAKHRVVLGRFVQLDRPGHGCRRRRRRRVVIATAGVAVFRVRPLVTSVEHGHYSGCLGGVVGHDHSQTPLRRSERPVHVRRQFGRRQPVRTVGHVRCQATVNRLQESHHSHRRAHRDSAPHLRAAAIRGGEIARVWLRRRVAIRFILYFG